METRDEAQQGIDAAKKDVERVKKAFDTSKNPHFRDSIDAIAHDEKAAKFLELLDKLEEDIPKVIEFAKELLEQGDNMNPKHEEVLDAFLFAHRRLENLMQEEASKKSA